MNKRHKWQVAAVFLCISAVFVFTAVLSDPDVSAQQKFSAPKLNVKIPGLNFSDYPIIIQNGKVSIPFLAAYVGAFYNYLLGISVVVAAIMIVYGGVHYIAGSSFAKIGKAKEIIKDALLGLLLILGSYLTLQVVNPSTITGLKPLEVDYIKEKTVSEFYGDGVPAEKLVPWEIPAIDTLTKTPSTPEPSTPTQGCGAEGGYTLPQRLCATGDECYKRFCKEKNYSPPQGIPDIKDLVGFIDIFPPTQKEQILEKGLAFFPINELCVTSKGCVTSKLFSVKTHGTGVSGNNLARMKGTMVFRPEARDALVKAGEEAKKRGYFLIIGDGTRTMSGVSQEWCRRIDKTGGTQGLVTPGVSPHMLGVAVDIALFQLMDNNTKYRQLTAVGICGQVENQEMIGIKYMRDLEEIMASGGFRHLASEVHHFNYRGVYMTDCTTGEWPGKYKTRQDAEKSCGGKKK